MTGEQLATKREVRWGRRVAAVAAAATLAACSSSEGSGTPQVTPTASSPTVERPAATTAPTHPSPTPSKPCKLEGAGMHAAIHTTGDVVRLSRTLVGQAVDIGSHTTKGECYEQVTFRFDGPKKSAAADRPGIYAGYVKTPLKKPSDQPVFVAGNAFLEVNMGSWWYKSGGGGDGPTAVASAQTHNIQTVQRTQNSEGVATWVIGVDKKQPFTVEEVSGTAQCPTECVVVKIAQPQK